MELDPDPELGERLFMALELAEAGRMMYRQVLIRRYPDATPAEIDRRMIAWVQDRPSDAPGGRLRTPGGSSRVA